MNNTNPFIPQGSLLEQKNKKRARFQVAVLSIFGFNVLLMVSILLIQGCKRDDSAQNDSSSQPLIASNAESNAPTADSSNVAPPLSPLPSNNIAMTPPNTMPNGQPSVPVTMPPVMTPANMGTASDYTIAAGDTLATIGKKMGVSARAIVAANPGVVPTKLKIGAKLHIPAPTMTASAGSPTTGMAVTDSSDGSIYTVKSGDTLGKIAKTHQTSVKAIRELNASVATTDRIKVGDKLKLPVKSSAASATALAPIDSNGVSTAATTPVSNPLPSAGH